MKKTIKTRFVLIIAITFFIACSNDDTPPVSTPTVTYSDTTINATLFQEGNSSAPTVNWNGNQGSFSLTSTIEGLNINTTTGVLNWTKLLAPKIHNVEVIATNSEGQIIINLTINNPFQGFFIGGINFDASSIGLDSSQEYTFNTNGSFITIGGGTGTYILSGTSITTEFISSIGTIYDALELSHTATEVKLTGYWSATIQNPTQTNADGYIELIYVD